MRQSAPRVLTESSDLRSRRCFGKCRRNRRRSLSAGRRDVATHGEAEGCEAERETGRFEHRRLSAWTPNPEGSASHRGKPMGCSRGVSERAG